MRPSQVLSFWLRLDLGVMEMKGYLPPSRSPELEPHHQMQFSVIPRTHTISEDMMMRI